MPFNKRFFWIVILYYRIQKRWPEKYIMTWICQIIGHNLSNITVLFKTVCQFNEYSLTLYKFIVLRPSVWKSRQMILELGLLFVSHKVCVYVYFRRSACMCSWIYVCVHVCVLFSACEVAVCCCCDRKQVWPFQIKTALGEKCLFDFSFSL